jgi:hypothetical protein
VHPLGHAQILCDRIDDRRKISASFPESSLPTGDPIHWIDYRTMRGQCFIGFAWSLISLDVTIDSASCRSVLGITRHTRHPSAGRFYPE